MVLNAQYDISQIWNEKCVFSKSLQIDTEFEGIVKLEQENFIFVPIKDWNVDFEKIRYCSLYFDNYNE